MPPSRAWAMTLPSTADARQLGERAVGVARRSRVATSARVARPWVRLMALRQARSSRYTPTQCGGRATSGGQADNDGSSAVDGPRGPAREGPYPGQPWSGSGSSGSPTPGSPRCTTPSPAAAPWRALRLRHHRPERRRRPGARPPARRAGRDEQSRNVVHATVQFVDIGGLVEGASKGEGLGNRSSATSARSTPSSSCCGRSTTTTSPAHRSARAPPRRRARAGPRRPRDGREADREAAQGGQGRQVARRRGRRPRRRPGRPRAEGTRSTGPT